MTTLNITVNSSPYSYNASDAQVAGLARVRSFVMGQLPVGEGQDQDTPVADRPGYVATDQAYLEHVIQGWADANKDASSQDIADTIDRALSSYAGVPPTPSPDVPLTPEAQIAALKAYAAAKRYSIEQGGISVGGLSVPTTDRAKLLIFGAASTLADDASADFVVGSTVTPLTGAQFKALHAAIVAHVQGCFAAQAAEIGRASCRERV